MRDQTHTTGFPVHLALLLLALSTVFVSGHDRGSFYRSWLHNAITSNHLTVAANLSPEHDFLGFRHQTLNRKGERHYEWYNRFPIGGSLLVKAAISPFPDDLSAQIHAARILMLAFFAAAVVAVYLSLLRLTSSPAVALAATLLGFSSFHPLYYSDMVATEGSIDLFAVMLTFHALVVFVQEGRFRQLVVKTCAALLLGWHVYALLLPFIVFGLAGEWFRGRGRPWTTRLAGLAGSRHLALGVVALAFGLSVLAFNIAREYAAVASSAAFFAQDREPTLANLPSFQSMSYRLGWDPGFNERHAGHLAWPSFLGHQFRRAGRVSLPYRLRPEDREADWPAWIAWGIIVSGVCAVGLVFARHRILLATLAAAGFCWGVLMRHSTAFHEFEGMFLVGLPLVFFSLALLQVRRVSERLVGGCAVAALLVFVLSSLQMNRGPDENASVYRAMLSDFDVIRGIATAGAVVFVPSTHRNSDRFSGAERSLNYFLSGRIIVTRLAGGRRRDRVDFVLTRKRTPDGTGLLTPDNREVFLHDRAAFDARYALLGAPVLEGGRGWNVHLVGTRLIYTTGEACSARRGFEDEPEFFIEAFDTGGSSVSLIPNTDLKFFEFRFHKERFEVAGRCLVEFHLPVHAYDVARIRTGQLVEGTPLWSGEFPLPAARPSNRNGSS